MRVEKHKVNESVVEDNRTTRGEDESKQAWKMEAIFTQLEEK